MDWGIGVMRRMGGMGSNGHYDDYPRNDRTLERRENVMAPDPSQEAGNCI